MMLRKTRAITNIVYIPKQGLSHFTEMVEWLKAHIGTGNFNYGGYGLWTTKNLSVFHFYDEESALLFKLTYGGVSDINE